MFSLFRSNKESEQAQAHDYEILESLAEKDSILEQTNITATRKIRLLNEFKIYIKTAVTDNETTYYRYITNTIISYIEKREIDNYYFIINETYQILPGFFTGNLYEHKTSIDHDQFFRIMAFGEL